MASSFTSKHQLAEVLAQNTTQALDCDRSDGRDLLHSNMLHTESVILAADILLHCKTVFLFSTKPFADLP
jgi:hypothetical protein